MSQWYNRSVKPDQFCICDKVRVFNDSVKPGHCPKLQHFYKDVAATVTLLSVLTMLLMLWHVLHGIQIVWYT